MTQHQCTGTLLVAKRIPQCSAALQHKLTAGLGQCQHTYEGFAVHIAVQ